MVVVSTTLLAVLDTLPRVIVEVPNAPRCMLTEPGFAPMVKGTTLTETLAVRDKEPLAPVKVIE